MDPVRIVRRIVRFGVRCVLIPGLIAATFLGLTAGGRGTATVSPDAATIASHLTVHHDLPKGTSLKLGDPAKPTVITYDDKGRIVVTPPGGETFGTILYRGMGEMKRIASQAGINLPPSSFPSTEATKVARLP